MTDFDPNKELAGYIAESIGNPPEPPLKRPKRNHPPRGIWAKLRTPEERSAHAKLMRSKVTAQGLARSGRKPGVPDGWTLEDYQAAEERAEKDAQQLFEAMERSGWFEGLHPGAAEAALEAFKLLRLPGSREFRLRVARTILEWFMLKPTAHHRVRRTTAEDILKELEGSAP